jgi:transposase
MCAAATQAAQYSVTSSSLLLAFELGQKTWKLGFSTGFTDRPWVREIAGGDTRALIEEVTRAKAQLKLRPDARVVSCYEAGRDGFWLHRFLVSVGIKSHVIDSSSIRVDRRARRIKTDRLDVCELLKMLVRFTAGEPKVWSVVHVPSLADEDARARHRELRTLVKERTRCTNRIKGLLMNHGLRLSMVGRQFLRWLDTAQLWDGTAVPVGVRQRLTREYERRELVHRQILALETEQRMVARTPTDQALAQIRQLQDLQGVGTKSASALVREFFAWRQFRSRRQVGALAGLTPGRFQSGDTDRDTGISKAGNRYVRAVAIELAWSWLRHQPHSALSRWYERRFGRGSPRARKVGIVALARKLLIALWQYLDFGVIPEDARLKT